MPFRPRFRETLHTILAVYPSLHSLAFIVLPVYSSSNLGYISQGLRHKPRFPRETSNQFCSFNQTTSVLPKVKCIHSCLNHSLNDPLKWIIHPKIKGIYLLEHDALSRIPQPALAPPQKGAANARNAAGLGLMSSTAPASPGTKKLLFLFPLNFLGGRDADKPCSERLVNKAQAAIYSHKTFPKMSM